MELNLLDNAKSKVQVLDAVFGSEFNEPLIHQVVTAYLAGARAGTKAQKTRAEVRGGGAKPWRQKGTGRARSGTIRSPIWRSGGRAFAAKPRDYSQKVNKKMYRVAMRSILSELQRQQRLLVVESMTMTEPKTKVLVAKLKEHNLNDVLIVTEGVDQNLYLSAKNLMKVDVRDTAGIDPVSLLAHENVLITVPALKLLEERLA